MSAEVELASPRQRSHHAPRREAGELPPPEFVIVGVPVAANRKRIYASLKIPAAKFGIEQIGYESTWHLTTAMPDMIVITRDTYADALDELMRVWANRWGSGLPKLGMGPGVDPAERRAARRGMLEAGDRHGYLHPDARRELAQIRALEAGEIVDAEIVEPGLRIDPDSRRAWLDGTELDLARRQFDLLHYLASRPGRLVTREELMDQVWGYGQGSSKTIDMHVSWVRRKLGDDAKNPQLIKTVRSVGFRYDGPVLPTYAQQLAAVTQQYHEMSARAQQAVNDAIADGARVTQTDNGWLVELP